MAEHVFVTRHTSPHQAPADARRDTEVPSTSTEGVVVLRSWPDTDLAARGHAVHSLYVERFWLGVLGPSATWLLRRLDDALAVAPGTDVSVDLVDLSRQMGLAYAPGRSSAFARAIDRCVMFGLAHRTADGLAVRRRLPPISERHLRRLPPAMVAEHDRLEAARSTPTVAERARVLATAMNAVGDCPGQVEQQLVAVGTPPTVAEQIVAECRSPVTPPAA